MFTYVFLVFIYVYHCLLVLTYLNHVYSCMFTYLYQDLHAMFTLLYLFLPLFTYVYSCYLVCNYGYQF